MKEKYNFAIIGCGTIAQRHANAISHFGNLFSVCDDNKTNAKSLSEKYNCAVFDDIDSMLFAKNEIDVVSICSPNYLHASQSIKCVESGFDVICEKPMAITVEDANLMVEASKRTGKNIFVVKQVRYYPHIEFIKNLIDDNVLGNIYSFHINCFWNRPDNYYKGWKGKKLTDGGTLFTQFSHYIDLLLWFFGDTKNVHFTSYNFSHPSIEFEDSGIITFNMKSGAIGSFNYNVNAISQNLENAISIFAEKGSLKISGAMLNQFEYFKIKNTTSPVNINATAIDKSQSHFKVYENIINALNGHHHSSLKAEESLKSIALIENIYKSQNKL